MKTIAIVLILVLPPLPRVTCDEDNDQPFRPNVVSGPLSLPPLTTESHRRPVMSAPFHNIGLLVSVCKEAVKEAEESGEPLPKWHAKMKGVLMMFEPNPKPDKPDDKP